MPLFKTKTMKKSPTKKDEKNNTLTTKKTYKITKKTIRKYSSQNQELDKYTPSSNKDIIHPTYWELPNRKHFYNWVMNTFGQYELGNAKKNKAYKKRISEEFELSNIQRLSRDYLQGESPVRGLLLYYGLGIGKTCTAITIAEAILTKKKVVIFSKTNLEPNWIKEIRTCGSDYVKNHNHWVFKNYNQIDNSTDEGEQGMHQLIKELGIPQSVIQSNGGVFLVDYTKNKSNFNELSSTHREKLDRQIESMIDERFEFVHSDNTSLWKKFNPEFINNKVVIWDEVHNLGNTMASKSQNAEKYYDMFMNAQNVKIIFLSGTPIINRIFEITKIYNILRGYMPVLEIQFKSTFDTGIDYGKLQYNLKQNKYVDQIIISKAKKQIKITKNPDNFITSSDTKGNSGIIYKPEENINTDKFKEDITKIIQTMGYKFNITEKKETCFPEDEDVFEQIFYNRELNKIKRIDLIKKRIVGLTSYYEYQDQSNYPQLKPINIVQVPMSEYQFGTYERFRHQEIEKEKFAKRQNKPEDAEMEQSSYRIKSRLACTFAFPEEIGNPYDSRNGEEYLEYIETLGEKLDNFDVRMSQAEAMKKKDIEKKIKEGYAQLLEKEKAKYLDIKNGSLAKYSPKYLAMILNIQKQAVIGKMLVYSFFVNLIGLNSFSYALIQTGKWAPFRIKKVGNGINKIWELDEREDEKDKWKFIFYTGNEDKEEREIYRKIINSEWNTLGADCEKLVMKLKTIHPNNYYGEIIKMIMTNKTGAEGLDLKEIRFINILDPYWQDVLISQIIGRGVRNKSHLNLSPKDRNVEVFIYMATITPNLTRKISYIDVRKDFYKYPNPALTDKVNKVVTSDEYLYLTAERKKYVINDFQRLMKESAFDCALNYRDNKLNPVNKNLVCMDYSTKNRDEYLYTPGLDDTIEGLEIAQEQVVTVKYGSFTYKGKTLYYELTPNALGKMYVYDENLVGKVRLPKPVGETVVKDGKRSFLFYAKKVKGKK
jgi:superfamily II DNA or RNA helicase